MRMYDPSSADQIAATDAADVHPSDSLDRQQWAQTLAMHAVVYGLPSVYQYAGMCDACAPAADGERWATNSLVHERTIAGAEFQAFRVPNVDTLYSNAWLDLFGWTDRRRSSRFR
jgi:hypothetical protein